MRILVYMRDGRTVYLLEKRSHLNLLLHREPDSTVGPSTAAVRGIWNPDTREYEWQRVHLRHIARNSVSVVEEARGIADAAKAELEAVA